MNILSSAHSPRAKFSHGPLPFDPDNTEDEEGKLKRTCNITRGPNESGAQYPCIDKDLILLERREGKVHNIFFCSRKGNTTNGRSIFDSGLSIINNKREILQNDCDLFLMHKRKAVKVTFVRIYKHILKA
jgi:hypothetical protein